MANKAFSDLTAATTIAAGDLLAIETAGGNSRKVTAANAAPGLGGMTLLGRYTGNGAAGTTNFSAIPATFSSLIVRAVGRSSAAALEADLLLRFGTGGSVDTGNNYDWQLTNAANTTLSGVASASTSSILLGGLPGATANTAVANVVGSAEAVIPRYADTVFHKNMTAAGFGKQGTATTTFRQRTIGGTWRNTGAITDVTVFLSAGNFVTGSIVELWAVP